MNGQKNEPWENSIVRLRLQSLGDHVSLAEGYSIDRNDTRVVMYSRVPGHLLADSTSQPASIMTDDCGRLYEQTVANLRRCPLRVLFLLQCWPSRLANVNHLPQIYEQARWRVGNYGRCLCLFSCRVALVVGCWSNSTSAERICRGLTLELRSQSVRRRGIPRIRDCRQPIARSFKYARVLRQPCAELKQFYDSYEHFGYIIPRYDDGHTWLENII